MPTVTYQVGVATDDAYATNTGSYSDSSSIIQIGNNGSPRTVGFRFTGVAIPQGAVIQSATLQLWLSSVGGTGTYKVLATVRGEATDNSLTFSNSTDRTSGSPDVRVTGTGSDTSTFDLATAVTGGFNYSLPALNAVQSVVSRSGWSSGNALALILTDGGSSDFNAAYVETYDFNTAHAAKLVVDYYVPLTPTAPATDWTALGKEDEKAYVYHVSTASGTFVGIWPDVADDPEFTQALNTPGTTMTVQLARSPNNKKEDRGYLLTTASERVTTEATEPVVIVTETPNNVGSGTDVDLNYNVDVYVVYGEFSRLITATGDYQTTEAGEYLMVGTGAPLGKRIFSGFILDYETEYGQNNGVTVTLASHGYELSQQLVLSGSNTTVTYTTTELGAMAKAILDTSPGKVTYDATSIANTSVSRTIKFTVNTKKEALDTIYEQTPADWYWYVNVGDNLLYLQQKSATADHTFIIGRDVKSLKLKKTIESLVNDIYFIGGEVTPGTPSTTLFKHYTDATSLTAYPRRGLKKITDRRYTVAANAQARSDKDFSRFKNPIFTSPLVISASKYDIETIKLGQTVQFRGAGNFLDTLAPLQIVKLKYLPTEVQLELGDLQRGQADTVADVQDSLENEQFIDLPNAPS